MTSTIQIKECRMAPSMQIMRGFRTPGIAAPHPKPEPDTVAAAAAEVVEALVGSCFALRSKRPTLEQPLLKQAPSPALDMLALDVPALDVPFMPHNYMLAQYGMIRMSPRSVDKEHDLAHLSTAIDLIRAAVDERQQWLAAQRLASATGDFDELLDPVRTGAAPFFSDRWEPSDTARERVALRVEERLMRTHAAAEEAAARVRAAHPPRQRVPQQPPHLRPDEPLPLLPPAVGNDDEALLAAERELAMVQAARSVLDGELLGGGDGYFPGNEFADDVLSVRTTSTLAPSLSLASSALTLGLLEGSDEHTSLSHALSVQSASSEQRALSMLSALSALGNDDAPAARRAARELAAGMLPSAEDPRPSSTKTTSALVDLTRAMANLVPGGDGGGGAERRAQSMLPPSTCTVGAAHVASAAPQANSIVMNDTAMLTTMLRSSSTEGQRAEVQTASLDSLDSLSARQVSRVQGTGYSASLDSLSALAALHATTSGQEQVARVQGGHVARVQGAGSTTSGQEQVAGRGDNTGGNSVVVGPSVSAAVDKKPRRRHSRAGEGRSMSEEGASSAAKAPRRRSFSEGASSAAKAPRRRSFSHELPFMGQGTGGQGTGYMVHELPFMGRRPSREDLGSTLDERLAKMTAAELENAEARVLSTSKASTAEPRRQASAAAPQPRPLSQQPAVAIHSPAAAATTLGPAVTATATGQYEYYEDDDGYDGEYDGGYEGENGHSEGYTERREAEVKAEEGLNLLAKTAEEAKAALAKAVAAEEAALAGLMMAESQVEEAQEAKVSNQQAVEELSRLETELASAQARETGLEKMVEQHAQNVTEAQQHLDVARKKRFGGSKERDEAQRVLSEQERKLVSAQAKLDESATKVAALEADIARKSTEVERRKKELSGLETARDQGLAAAHGEVKAREAARREAEHTAADASAAAERERLRVMSQAERPTRTSLTHASFTGTSESTFGRPRTLQAEDVCLCLARPATARPCASPSPAHHH